MAEYPKGPRIHDPRSGGAVPPPHRPPAVSGPGSYGGTVPAAKPTSRGHGNKVGYGPRLVPKGQK